MKRGEVFSFIDGTLRVKIDGYGEQNGWGQFVFDEKQVEFTPHEEDSGSSLVVDVPKSELIELRDFLNRLFPLAATHGDGK